MAGHILGNIEQTDESGKIVLANVRSARQREGSKRF